MNDTGFTAKQKKELQKALGRTKEEMMQIIRPMQETLDRVTQKLLEHDQRFERMEEQLERIKLLPTYDDFATLMDRFMGRVTACEEEHVFMESRITRCEEYWGFA